MNKTIVTVDGPTSQDLDDAFSITRAGNAWSLDVYVTNVARAIQSEPEYVYLDAENRVVTQYVGGYATRPMLPKSISEDKMSLLQGRHRKVMKANILIQQSGEAELIDITSTSVTNHARLSYEQVTKTHTIEDPGAVLAVIEGLDCALALFQRRTMKQDTLSFIDIENGILSDEEGQLHKVKRSQIHGHILIQEFMILTNTLMADWCLENKLPIIYRNHEAKNIDDLSGAMHEVYSAMPIEEQSRRLRSYCNKANYSMFNKGHVGLNQLAYATFTSPLRRFPDLYNQKVIEAFLDGDEIELFSEQRCQRLNERLVDMSSDREARSKQQAVRNAIKVLNANPQSITTSQIAQIVKRGENPDVIDRALNHFLADAELMMSSQVWVAVVFYADKIGCSARYAPELKQRLGDSLLRNLPMMKTVLQILQQQVGKSLPIGNLNELTNLIVEVFDLDIETIQNEINNDKASVMNYKGKLFELCQKLGVANPEFESFNLGEAHLPAWETKGTVTIGSINFTATTKKAQKKEAEQEVSKDLFEQITEQGVDVQADKQPDTPQLVENSKTKSAQTSLPNPKGHFYELCASMGIASPVAEMTSSGSSHEPQWVATISFVYNGTEYTANSSSGSKKDAEKQAFQQLINDTQDVINAAIDEPKPAAVSNAKSWLNELMQKNQLAMPIYRTQTLDMQPRMFKAIVTFDYNGQKFEIEGPTMPSKKKAESSAADIAVADIQNA